MPEATRPRKCDTAVDFAFEARLWQTATVLRYNIDAAEHKPAGLGPIMPSMPSVLAM